MEHILVGWKRLYISKRVWLTLIEKHSLFTCILLVFISIPVEVTTKLKKLQKDCFWGDLSDEIEFFGRCKSD